MQRLVYLRIGTFRFVDTRKIVFNSNYLTLKRCLSNNNDLSSNKNLYKPSTATKETHVTDDLKGTQSKQTINTTPTLTGGEKIWSSQNPGSVHIAPLGATSTKFAPSSPNDSKPSHETTVYTTQGELSFADPFNTHTSLHGDTTPGQLAEAAAASAFETFAPDTPLDTPPITDTVFAPKISSTDVHSTTSSPTAHFEYTVASSIHDAAKYESTYQSTVFGGQDTLASSKEHPQEDLYHSKKTHKTSDTQEVPIQRESDVRDDILREALKYVDEKGWTMDAIRAGVLASNQPTTVEGLFSNGYDLVDYFLRDANAKMSAHMNEKAKNGELQGTRLLIDGLKYRLRLVIPYARNWDQALAQGALPQNAMRGWKNLLDLSSDAWHGIGDTSTDINWYSKRLLLAAVYKSSEIYMLQDQSQDKIETMNFLERRLSDFQTIGSVRNSVSKSLSDTAQIASGLFSVVKNLTSRR